MITVEQKKGGKWVVRKDGLIISEHDTNADAWRAADRMNNDIISPSEKKAEFIFNKSAGT